ncbi:glycosyltransferase [Magnetospira sp. QH-2]|uniref:glycosyltransferase n=1 Tax=Magnetospira sp. (strain QH-2) TaxID=1288970 RepID=UPI0003E81176|nr:glycosyltransferase [Magnetospira sp. QH-2]CCQ73416.1 Putative GT4 : distantly related to 1L-myo-inositol-1-P a-N-acetylglucoaminyltransferase [Magnetospira sp. QH-2]
MIRVAVLVDLEWRPTAGGHVKCWERLAAAAVRRDDIDLTVHFSGKEEQVHQLAPHVRYIVHKPVFSTARLPFLSHVPDHTDLAPYHWGLAGLLRGAQVIHTTDGFFNFAKTALTVSRRAGIPLTNSIHTDTPAYTEVFTARTIERLFGTGWLTRLLLDRFKIHERARDKAARNLARHQAGCCHILVSRSDEYQRARAVQPQERIGMLRRGIETEVFDPARRDRKWLATVYGVPENRTVVMYAGRMNRGKSVMGLAESVRTRLEAGDDLHLLCAGEGEERQAVAGLLADRASCPGAVPADEVARMMASADLFAFPSEIEVNANVPMEAQASGLATLVAERGASAKAVLDGETGLVLPGSAVIWAEALHELIADPKRRAAMGQAARAHALADFPSWDHVLAEDLMPVWRAAVGDERGS